MSDPKTPQPASPTDATTPIAPKSGGFGAHAALYRARWAASHPGMTKRWSEGASAAEPGPEVGSADPAREGDAPSVEPSTDER
jgi:hypothetical protein